MVKLHPGGRAVALLVAVTVAAVAGCATAPSNDAPRSLSGQSSQQQAYVQPLPPPPPKAWWSAEQVVLAFLAANASSELDPSAARQYLASPKQWRPSGAVIVVSPDLTVNLLNIPRGAGQPTAYEQVTVQGTRLATLSGRGQYLYQPGGTTYHFSFLLARQNGIYKIQSPLPGKVSTTLLLSQTAFDQVFQPRNLYFFGRPPGSAGYLVPDPVFAPVQSPTVANTTGLASELVQGLFFVPGRSWLAGATTTAFPPGTRLIAVTISNQTAVVDLGGSAAHATRGQLAEMLAQLSETLMSPSYSAPVVQHVKLATDGKLRHLPASRTVVPAVGGATQGRLYFTAPGQVYQVSGKSAPVLVPGPELAGQQITALAVTSGHPRLAVAVSGNGCTVYAASGAGSARDYRSYRLGRTYGPCESLSWGAGGSLWAVAGSRVWLLQSGQVQPVGLSPRKLTPKGRPLQPLTMAMAPDGIRVALLVRTGTHHGLMLGAPAQNPVTGKVTLNVVPVGVGLANPAAVSWYKPDELLALDGTELYAVPLTGGQPTLLGSVPYSNVASMATTGSEVALRTTDNVIYTSQGLSGRWTRVKSPAALGPAAPVYAG
jgi:Sporulation and spore germination